MNDNGWAMLTLDPVSACPLCDVERLNLTPTEAFALGLGVRPSLQEDQSLASQMCERHRSPLSRAMMTLAHKVVGGMKPPTPGGDPPG